MTRTTADEWAADVENERAALRRSESAELKHRVIDRRQWHRELAARRERILLKEMLATEARAREEAEAELAEHFRPGDAA